MEDKKLEEKKVESGIVEYELILDVTDLPKEDDEKLIDYVMDLESVIKDKVEDIKVNIVEGMIKKIENKEFPIEVLNNNEFDIDKHPVGVNGENFIVDVKLIYVLSHHRVTVRMPNQVHKTDKDGNIEKKDDGSS